MLISYPFLEYRSKFSEVHCAWYHLGLQMAMLYNIERTLSTTRSFVGKHIWIPYIVGFGNRAISSFLWLTIPSLQCLETALGLQYLHGIDIIHGDVRGVSFAISYPVNFSFVRSPIYWLMTMKAFAWATLDFLLWPKSRVAMLAPPEELGGGWRQNL